MIYSCRNFPIPSSGTLPKGRIPDEEELLKRKELHQGKVYIFPFKTGIMIQEA
jgi:hypothetical protein